MAKRSRSAAGIDLSNILPGFRTTRSSREFNPFALPAADIVLEYIDPVELIVAGHIRQEAALAQGEMDEVEEPAPRSLPYRQNPAVVKFVHLSSLLYRQPIPRPVPIPYIPDMSLDAEARRKHKTAHKNREKRRLSRWQEQESSVAGLKAVAVKKARLTVEDAIVSEFKPVCLTGWSGPRNVATKHHLTVISTPDALSRAGLTLVRWDGRHTRLVRTADHTRFVVLGGSAGLDVERLDRLFNEAFQAFHLPKKYQHTRRGEYGSFGGGVSFGNGRTEPGNFAMSSHNAGVFRKVVADPEMQKLARYCDHLLLAYFPKVHALLTNLLRKIIDADDELEQIFPGCCYAAFHMNMNKAATKPHNDFLNGFFTGCGVGAFGPYDPTRGGHLILWDLGLVIEFPPGCVIILPSALITHSNIPIRSEERRHSAAFFTAAGLLRWYHNGYMSDKDFILRASKEQLAGWKLYRENLWKVAQEMMRE